MSWFQPVQSSASERYQRRSFVLLLIFAAVLLWMRWLRTQQPGGVLLEPSVIFSVAAFGALPRARGAYLNEERDEFQRNIEIRGLLAGAAALLVVFVFFSFLHELGWHGYVDPVTDLLTFALVNGAVKLGYRFCARVEGDD